MTHKIQYATFVLVHKNKLLFWKQVIDKVISQNGPLFQTAKITKFEAPKFTESECSNIWQGHGISKL